MGEVSGTVESMGDVGGTIDLLIDTVKKIFEKNFPSVQVGINALLVSGPSNF